MKEQEAVLEEERMIFGVHWMEGFTVRSSWLNCKNAATALADFLSKQDIDVQIIVDKRERV